MAKRWVRCDCCEDVVAPKNSRWDELGQTLCLECHVDQEAVGLAIREYRRRFGRPYRRFLVNREEGYWWRSLPTAPG